MSLTKDQNIPAQPQEAERVWTFRPLLSMRKSIQTVIEKYNAFELIFFVMILTTATAILFNRNIPWVWYIFLFLVMIISLKKEIPLNNKEDDNKNT